MSASTLTTLFFDHGVPRTSQPRDISERNSSSNMSSSNMFSSFKNKLSRRGTSKSTSSKASTTRGGQAVNSLQSNNPYSSTAPPTRRPDRPGMNAFSTPSNEPPPAYTPGPAGQAAAGPAPNVATDADDRYDFLKSFDTIFLIDDSGSMAGRSWRETGEALKTITPICTQRDADGIDIYFLNHPDSSIYKNVKTASTVQEIFQTVKPGGGTPTGQRLNKILRPYLQRYQADPDGTKPINVIVITDGAPSDDVESVIINAAKKLDKLEAPAWQVGIQFFQVGREEGAREHLKQLDDGLAELAGDDELRDMVDTVPFTGAQNEELSAQGVLKVVLGSVNRRVDRSSKELYRRK